MGNKEDTVGSLYVDGEKISNIYDEVDFSKEVDGSLKESLSHPVEATFVIRKNKHNRLNLLSLIYGFRVTNNWIKLHGGVMCRNYRKGGN